MSDDRGDIKAFAQTINHDRALRKALVELRAAEATENGLFVWRAYLHCRRAGVPLPDELLKVLDGFAARLLQAEQPDDVPAAMNMQTRGGHTSMRRVKTHGKLLKAVVAFVQGRAFYGGALKSDASLLRVVAEEHSMSVAALKKAVQRWEDAERVRQRRPKQIKLARSVFEWGQDS